MNKSPVCALLALVSGAPAAAQKEVVRFEQTYERLDAYVAQEMQAEGTPGLVLALTNRDGLLRVATYGFADIKTRAPVTPQTRFEIGSISKSFTAISLLQLHDEGRFDPKAPVSKYLPWFSIRSKYTPVTSHDLLSHSGGLPRDRDDIPSSLYQAIAVRERETGYAPGAKFAYSNIDYQILSYLLESIEGKPYAEIIQKRLLNPLEMTSSAAQLTSATRSILATGYVPLYDDRPSRRSDDSFLVDHPDFSLFPVVFGRDKDKKVVEAFYGSDWYTNSRYAGPRSLEVPHEWAPYPGHYRTQDPWLSNFRVVSSKGKLWLAYVEGNEEELVPLSPGLFQIGVEPTAERLQLDTVIEGKAQRAILSGKAFYRTFTP